MKALNIIALFLIGLLYLSCNNNEKLDNYIITHPSKDTIKISNLIINIHQAQNNRFVENLYLEMDNYNKLNTTVVERMDLVLRDSVYSVEGIEIMFSREMPNSDFIFPQENTTLFPSIDTINGRKMILIWPQSKPLGYILKSGINVDSIKTFSDKLTPEVFLEK